MFPIIRSLVVEALVVLSVLCFSGAVSAIEVTIQCDMSVEIELGTFDAVEDSVYVRGELNGWSCDTELFDDDEDQVYEVTVDQSAGTYAYKFNTNCLVNGGRWEEDPNRFYTLDADPITVRRFFNDVEGNFDIRVNFEADMSVLIACGSFNSDNGDTVDVRGEFNDWSGGQLLADSDADGVYSLSVDLDNVEARNWPYKFHIDFGGGGDRWEDDPNKVYTVDSSLLEIPDTGGRREVTVSRFFNNDTTEGLDYEIFYSVDMSVQIELGNFDPMTDQVRVRGEATRWSCEDETLLQPGAENDEIYEGWIEARCELRESLDHKFSTGCGEEDYERPEVRTVSLSGDEPDNDGDNLREVVVPTVFWNDADMAIPKEEIEILFQVDMSLQIATGNFDPLNDSVNVRGDFNNWGCWSMTSSVDNAAIFELLVEQADAMVGTYPYKFNINCEDSGYETGANREYTVTGDEEDSDGNNFKEVNILRFFNDGSGADILLESVTAILSVDVTSVFNALDAGEIIDVLQGTGNAIHSRSEIAGVGVTGASATLGSYNWGTFVPGQFLRDDGADSDLVAGDNVFTGVFVFQAGEDRRQVVKFGLNGSDNEAGFDENHVFDLIEDCIMEGGGDDSRCRLPSACFGERNTDTALPFGSVDGAHDCTVLATRFRRGDSDQDGAVTFGDSIKHLEFEFLGQNGELIEKCRDASDVDDSGDDDFNDDIVRLRFLFLGTGSIAAPAPTENDHPCGVDPTVDDDVDCAEYSPTVACP